ncbi:hypothetical protein GCM10010245_82230 [Streptomyces spectabilis]|nr:hypothetical protein GCM10010245_82230 [Streptomyces spectabilis]
MAIDASRLTLMPLRETAAQRPPGTHRHPQRLTWLSPSPYGLTTSNLYHSQPLLPHRLPHGVHEVVAGQPSVRLAVVGDGVVDVIGVVLAAGAVEVAVSRRRRGRGGKDSSDGKHRG